MTPWINLICLIIATKLFLYFYVKSVGPAALKKRIGKRATSGESGKVAQVIKVIALP